MRGGKRKELRIFRSWRLRLLYASLASNSDSNFKLRPGPYPLVGSSAKGGILSRTRHTGHTCHTRHTRHINSDTSHISSHPIPTSFRFPFRPFRHSTPDLHLIVPDPIVHRG